MRRRRAGWLISALLVLALPGGLGCNPIFFGKNPGLAAWYRVEPRADGDYEKAFSLMTLGLDSPPCDWLRKNLDRTHHPIFVFVHGMGADHAEWHPVLPLLAATHPSAMFMYRWAALASRDALVEDLATGVSRLAQCLSQEEHPIFLLAHSAGGVIAAYAAGRINVPPGAPLPGVYVFTIATMLAGTTTRPPNSDGSERADLFLDLGTSIAEYPRAAYGVEVFHLRTRYPADYFMKPESGGHLPNDRAIGVKGARQIDLPADTEHDPAVLYVAEQIADGAWTQWSTAAH